MGYEELMALGEDILEKKISKKKRINSKKKGSRGELKVCKILSEHFGKNFNRVPNSGAFGSTHELSENAGTVLAGDIICPDDFLFIIENKAGYDIDLINFFCSEKTKSKKKSSDKTTIFDFVEQSLRDAYRVNKIPSVIYTKDRRPPLIIIPFKDFPKEDVLIKYLSEFEQYLIFNYVHKNIKLWTIWILVSLEELLSIMPKDFFYE